MVMWFLLLALGSAYTQPEPTFHLSSPEVECRSEQVQMVCKDGVCLQKTIRSAGCTSPRSVTTYTVCQQDTFFYKSSVCNGACCSAMSSAFIAITMLISILMIFGLFCFLHWNLFRTRELSGSETIGRPTSIAISQYRDPYVPSHEPSAHPIALWPICPPVPAHRPSLGKHREEGESGMITVKAYGRREAREEGKVESPVSLSSPEQVVSTRPRPKPRFIQPRLIAIEEESIEESVGTVAKVENNHSKPSTGRCVNDVHSENGECSKSHRAANTEGSGDFKQSHLNSGTNIKKEDSINQNVKSSETQTENRTVKQKKKDSSKNFSKLDAKGMKENLSSDGKTQVGASVSPRKEDVVERDYTKDNLKVEKSKELVVSDEEEWTDARTEQKKETA